VSLLYNVTSHDWPIYVFMAVSVARGLGQLALAFFALKRAEPTKIAEVVRELARWWHRWTWRREG
jgi:hypothetical protein